MAGDAVAAPDTEREDPMTTLLHYLSEYFGSAANWTGPGGIPTRIREHVGYTLLALVLAFAVAFPLGLWTGHTGRGGGAVVTLVANSARALRPTVCSCCSWCCPGSGWCRC